MREFPLSALSSGLRALPVARRPPGGVASGHEDAANPASGNRGLAFKVGTVMAMEPSEGRI